MQVVFFCLAKAQSPSSKLHCCVADLFWWLSKVEGIYNWLPIDTCCLSKRNWAPAWAATPSCLSTTDCCFKLKIQYSFMELQILRLIKFSSCRQSLTSLPAGDSWCGKAESIFLTVSYSLTSFNHPPPAFLLEERFQNERDVKEKSQLKKKKKKKKNGSEKWQAGVKTIHPR